MRSHPGGEAQTRRMLALAGLPRGAAVLDMGAGAGETLALLRAEGFRAQGIDLEPRSESVEQGNILRAPFPDASFDAVLGQCAFTASGDLRGALREAARLLRYGGKLLLADAFFEPPEPILAASGIELLRAEDLSGMWRDYILEALWRDDCPIEIPRGKCRYWMLIGRKV